MDNAKRIRVVVKNFHRGVYTWTEAFTLLLSLSKSIEDAEKLIGTEEEYKKALHEANLK